MLSFLRDQNGEGLPEQGQLNQIGPIEDATKAVDKSQEQEYFTVSTHKHRTRKSTVVLSIFFIIGMLCLWFMIRKSTPQAVSADTNDTEDAKIEAAITRLTGVKSDVSSNMDGLAKKFYEFSDVLQVQVSELAKNPFKLESEVKQQAVIETEGPDDQALLRQRMLQKTKGMELLSIMRTDKGDCCMIGSSILYEGDRIDDFKVTVISDNSVKLKWDPENADANSGDQPEVVEIVLKLTR